VLENTTGQLARTGLPPKDLSSAILGKEVPKTEDLTPELLQYAVDCEAAIRLTDGSTRNERRLARGSLASAFLSAYVLQLDRACDAPKANKIS
jgi:hypothetical protein